MLSEATEWRYPFIVTDDLKVIIIATEMVATKEVNDDKAMEVEEKILRKKFLGK